MSSKQLKIVAATACPTGIAHTFMAAAKLEEKAKKHGHSIFIEKHGGSGLTDALTEAQIAEADVVIVAAGRKIHLDKFKGKKIYEVDVGKAIKHADQIIKDIESNLEKLPIYGASSSDETDDIFAIGDKQGLYKHLMTGMSYMLPFIVAGGIFIGFSFMFGIFAGNPDHETYHPIAGFLSQWGGTAFGFIATILAGYIGYSIADRPAIMPAMVGGQVAFQMGAGFLGGIVAGIVAGYSMLYIIKAMKVIPKSLESLKPILFYPLAGLLVTGLILYPILSPIAFITEVITSWLNSLDTSQRVLIGLIIGAMMATDMGGPINKTAALFANAAFINTGNAYFLASMMAGGMIPPLGIALATTIFAKTFTEAERKAGKSCYFLGSCFITEGVIPFAAADPLRVIPACILGGAFGGALTQFFGISLTAPHGGIFVFPLASNVLLYITAILAGSLITALVLGGLKVSKIKKTKNKGEHYEHRESLARH